MDAILPFENYKKTLFIDLDKYKWFMIFVRAQGSIYSFAYSKKVMGIDLVFFIWHEMSSQPQVGFDQVSCVLVFDQ